MLLLISVEMAKIHQRDDRAVECNFLEWINRCAQCVPPVKILDLPVHLERLLEMFLSVGKGERMHRMGQERAAVPVLRGEVVLRRHLVQKDVGEKSKEVAAVLSLEHLQRVALLPDVLLDTNQWVQYFSCLGKSAR